MFCLDYSPPNFVASITLLCTPNTLFIEMNQFGCDMLEQSQFRQYIRGFDETNEAMTERQMGFRGENGRVASFRENTGSYKCLWVNLKPHNNFKMNCTVQ